MQITFLNKWTLLDIPVNCMTRTQIKTNCVNMINCMTRTQTNCVNTITNLTNCDS